MNLVDLCQRATHVLLQAPTPENEGRPKFILMSNLTLLQLYINKFAAAVAIYDLCDPSSPNPAVPSQHVNMMRFVGGDDGAMTIWHVARLIEETRGHLHEVPSLLPRINTGELKLAEKLLKSAFPQFENLRHASAHASELFSNIESANKNTPAGAFDTPIGKMKNDGGIIAVGSSFHNRTYFTMIDKQVVSYDLSWACHAKLEGIAKRVYLSFITS